MKNLLKKHAFNMIEVAVSLVLVLVVMLSAVSLFKVGFAVNEAAISRSNAADALDQFIHHMASRIEQDWTEVDAFPDEQAETQGDIIWSVSSLITNANYQLNYQSSNELQAYNSQIHNSGFYRIVQSTDSLGEDFAAEIRVWKSLTEYGSGEDRPQSIVMYVELSWPLTKAYENRTKKSFQTQIYKPGLLASTETSNTSMLCKTLWAIDDDGSYLYYYVLSEGNTFANIEGQLSPALDPSALTISSGGSIFFVSSNTLYSIGADSLDLDPSTNVEPTNVGGTGLSGNDEITAMKFISNVLYGISKKSKKVYTINSSTGEATFSANLDINGSFEVGAMTVGANGSVYVSRTNGNESEIYGFESFPAGELTLAVTVGGSGDLNALSAHPNGLLYAADSTKWYWIYPETQSYEVELNHSTTLQGFDFDYNFEAANCEENLSMSSTCESLGEVGGSININPNNSPNNEFTMTTPDGTITRDNLINAYSGYSGNATVIRLKPKGNGNQNGLMVDGEIFPLNNGQTYVLTGDMTVNLYNTSNGNGNAMGKWWIDITSDDATVTNCDCSSEDAELIEDEDSPCIETAPDDVTVDTEEDTNFDVENGEIVLTDDVDTTFRIVGGDMSYSGGQLNVTLKFNISGASYEPLGPFNPAVSGYILDGQQHDFEAGVLESGTEIAIVARSWKIRRRRSGTQNWHWNSWMERSSAPSNTNVYVLRDGDPVPQIAAFGDQDSIAEYVAPYVDAETGLISLSDNQAILLYELYTTNRSSSASDFQDVVILVTMSDDNTQ